MKRTALIGLFALSLSACSTPSANDPGYALAISGVTGNRVTQAAEAAARVVERVAASMNQELTTKELTKREGDYVLRVQLKDPAALPVLTDILTSGFRFRLMLEWPLETADVRAKLQSGEIGFKETGITENDLQWVETQRVTTTDSQGKTVEAGQVTIELTPAGRDVFRRILQENPNKMVSLYVRDRLVSTMRVEPNQPAESIVISNVPSFEVANVFADDVNVGLHVQFIPQGAAAAPAAGTGSAAQSSVPAASAASSR